MTSDMSDDGVDPDPNGNGDPGDPGEDDPTPIVIGENPVIGVSKDASISGNVVTLDFYLENLGNATKRLRYSEKRTNFRPPRSRKVTVYLRKFRRFSCKNGVDDQLPTL